jgi:hypothetical protein
MQQDGPPCATGSGHIIALYIFGCARQHRRDGHAAEHARLDFTREDA